MSEPEREEVFSIPIPFTDRKLALYERTLPGPSLNERLERIETEIRDGPCAICGEETNSLAGQPSQWPLHFVPIDTDEPGKVEPHHVACVSEQLMERRELQAKLAQAHEAFAGEPGAHEQMAEDLGIEKSPYEQLDEALKALNFIEGKLMLMGELEDEARETERWEALQEIRSVIGTLEERGLDDVSDIDDEPEELEPICREHELNVVYDRVARNRRPCIVCGKLTGRREDPRALVYHDMSIVEDDDDR